MITLSRQEQFKLEIIVKVLTGMISRKTAGLLLKVSDRTIRRYLKAYREKSIESIQHGNRGKSPPNAYPVELKAQVLELIKEKYFDFNVVHLREKLAEEEGVHIGKETLRKWCHEIRMMKRKKRKRGRPHFYRHRIPQEGLMIQMDGSTHEWFGGRRTCLVVTIDDAMGDPPYADFFEGETTVACLEVLKNVVKEKGTFKILHTDKAGVLGGIKREGFSQVKRSLMEKEKRN